MKLEDAILNCVDRAIRGGIIQIEVAYRVSVARMPAPQTLLGGLPFRLLLLQGA